MLRQKSAARQPAHVKKHPKRSTRTTSTRHCASKCSSPSLLHHSTAPFATTTISADPPNTTTDTTPVKAVLTKDPVERFQSRNAFIKRRHVSKDHLVHTHQNDVRIFAVNLTETLREAVRKHKMTRLEAEVWGGYAAGTALYAGTLRGNDRVVFEAYLNNENDETNHVYVEAFAVGEIRGFSAIPHVGKTENGFEHPGAGAVRLTKAIYAHKRKYQSSLPAVGDPMHDWQTIYSQSEQIPTYIQPETIVDLDENGEVVVSFCGAALVQVLGGDADPAEKARALAEKKITRLEEETDDQYAKRSQLFEFRNKVVESDLPSIISEYGAAGYVANLLGLEPDTLGRPKKFKNTGNISDEFDYEIFERTLLSSALRDKPLSHVVNTETGSAVTEVDLKDGGHPYAFEYRPLQFFCRCFQAPPQQKLASLPIDLLETLVQDEDVTFSCDFCATDTQITQDMITGAIAAQKEMHEKIQEQRKAEIEAQDSLQNDGTPVLENATPHTDKM